MMFKAKTVYKSKTHVFPIQATHGRMTNKLLGQCKLI